MKIPKNGTREHLQKNSRSNSVRGNSDQDVQQFISFCISFEFERVVEINFNLILQEVMGNVKVCMTALGVTKMFKKNVHIDFEEPKARCLSKALRGHRSRENSRQLALNDHNTNNR